jgi:hypothetical protein
MKHISKLVLASTLVLSFTACKKQLDLRPTDTIDDTKAFQTVGDLEKGAIGAYSAYGGGQSNGIYIASILADEAKISSENRGQGQFSFKWQYTASGSEHNADFANFYRAIDRLNRVIAVSDDIQATNATEAALKNRVRAELLAIRGMSHYELLRRFMPSGYDANALGVPIMLTSELTGLPARSTVGAVMAQIESDLATARGIAELPNAVTDGLRLSKAAVAAYQARAALLKRDWNAAATYATDAITLSGTTLTTRTQFPSIWTDVTNTGVIFRLRNNYTPQLYFRDVNGDVFFEPSDKLKQQFNRTTDIRFSTFFGTGAGDTSIVVKYPGSALQGPQRNDIKDVRIAEMYLLRAEARAELNQLATAAADVNLIRANRITGYVDVTFATKDIAITEIINERFKELAYEGFRFFDLKRRGLGVTRLASDVQSTSWMSLPAGDFHFGLPIPQHELLANPNAQQNPGY